MRDHPLRNSILMHLLPGVAIFASYALITPFLRRAGWPSMTGMWLAALTVLIPIELGSLYWLGEKRNGSFSLDGIVLNRAKISIGPFVRMLSAVLIWSLVCQLLLSPLDTWIESQISWLPGWFSVAEDFSIYSKEIQFINFLGAFVVIAVCAPWVEELYFRGYLLPRMRWMGRWAPLVGAFLFALYHFWLPWQLISRFLVVLPLVYVVHHTNDLRVGLAMHWILNTIGVMGLLITFLK